MIFFFFGEGGSVKNIMTPVLHPCNENFVSTR